MDQSDLDLLQSVPAYHLQAVVKTRKVPISPLVFTSGSSISTPAAATLAPSIIRDLARCLFDPVLVTEVVQELREPDTTILSELAACGGRVNSRDLALYCTQKSTVTPARKTSTDDTDSPGLARPNMPLQPPQYPAAHPHGTFEQGVRRLMILGLVFWSKQTNFAGRDYTSGIHDGILIMPQAVVQVVCQLQECNSDFFAHHPVPQEASESIRKLQRSLYLYWSLVAQQKGGMTLLNSGLLSRSSLRLAIEQIGLKEPAESLRGENDLPFLLFLRLLLTDLGLLRVQQQCLIAMPSISFFSLPIFERARLCYQCYIKKPFWNEMLYLPEVNIKPGPAPLDAAHPEILLARQAIIQRLHCEEFDEWHDLATFIARTRLYVPYLLFPRNYGARAERYSSSSNPYQWEFRLRRGWLTHREGWHMVEGGFVRAFIGGPLYWLGLVELDREENPTSFCINSDAVLIMSEQSKESELSSATTFDVVLEHSGRLIVQPNFELVAMAPLEEALLVRLDSFAERLSLEHVAQYRLTKASVLRALQRGWYAADILSFLTTASSEDIPQNVHYSILEWERQARRIEIRPQATLMEVKDPLLLDQLYSQEQTKTFFIRRLSDHLVEVAPGKLNALQAVLWQYQTLPALTSAQSETEKTFDDVKHSVSDNVYETQWRLHADGLLEPCWPVLDLYTVAEAERFCVRDQATGWLRLTVDSIQQALQQGKELTAILTFLQRYCLQGIPVPLLMRLKLWGKGYGKQEAIKVEQAPFLRLSPEVLHDLLEDQEVKILLGEMVEEQTRLVRIKPENQATIVALLRDRGFLVDE